MASKQQINQAEFVKFIADVNEKALQSMEFLSTTLTWARSNFDSIQIKCEEFELRNLATEVVQLYEASLSAKNMDVVVSVDHNFRIRADREIIFTVLRNLISNAIKFTDRNGKIEIVGYHENRMSYIVVKDTGIGMDGATAARILSSNYDSSVGTQGEKGLGIGIMLCHDLLKRMGASLTVESILGKGTSMAVAIPELPN
jgi:signal transduction histidine kinase